MLPVSEKRENFPAKVTAMIQYCKDINVLEKATANNNHEALRELFVKSPKIIETIFSNQNI